MTNFEEKKNQYERIRTRIRNEIGENDWLDSLIIITDLFGIYAKEAIKDESKMSELSEEVRRACKIIVEEFEKDD